MKQHISVLGLFARVTLLPILGILLLMGAVEVFVFHCELQGALAAYEAGVGGGFPQLERLLSSAATYAWFRGGLILTAAVLCLCGCQFRAQTNYTWRRLSLKEPVIFGWQALYNTAVFALLMLAQNLIAFGLCRYYIAVAPAEVLSNQTLFLAFYRSNFLHSLLPLADGALWARNILLLLSLGLAAAILPYKQRRGKISGSIIAVLTYATVGFDCEIGQLGHTALAATILVMVGAEVIAALLYGDNEGTEENREEADDHA